MYRQQRQHEARQSERRVILLGKTGNGKSSTGNSLLRKDAFVNDGGLNAVTEKCTINCGTNTPNNIRYTVVDTPGLLDTSKSVSERALEIQKSVLYICPNPHTFLLVFNASSRMTTDEQFTIDMIRIIFGEVIFKHAIVVFTHGEKFESDAEFKQFWTKNEYSVKLAELCGNRVAKIANDKDYFNDNADRECLIKMIEEMSGGGKYVYNYKELKSHKEVIEEHSKAYSGTGNVHEEVSDMVQRLGKKLNRKMWKIMLYGGILIGGGAMGAGYLAGSTGAVNTVVASGLGASVISNAVAMSGAVARTAGSAVNAAAATRVGTAVLNNGAAVGGAVVRTAWNVATKIRLW